MSQATRNQVVMFLCTGNYYRSRFAEYLFNHLAKEKNLNWVADSRGLDCAFGAIVNVGPIARFTVEALAKRNIPCPLPRRMPQQVSEKDLASADLVIALKEAEHRQLMEKLHPAWADRITYWHVHDLDKATAEKALPEVEKLVRELVGKLSAQKE